MLALPLGASAQNYDPVVTDEAYDALPIDGTTTPVTTLVVTGSAATGYATISPLPFPFVFYNEFFNDAVVSTEGFVMFGQGTAGATQSTNAAIPNLADPNGFIAPWWDNLNCNPGTMKTQEYGNPGSRVFVIEWDGCTINSTTGRTLQMQVRLTENSPIARVYYGTLGGTSTTASSATVGIENPPQTDPNTGAQIAPGGTRGLYAPIGCTNSCAHANWPANKMIQWGRTTLPDLQAGKNLQGYKGLRITSLSKGATQLTATLENNIENAGLNAATGVTWKYYLSSDSQLDANDPELPCAHSNPETLNGYRNPPAIHTFNDTCVFNNPPSGSYRICTWLDPAGTLVQASTANDKYCSEEFVLGSDLIGGIDISTQGGLGSFTTVEVHLENRGSDPTGEFGYQVFWRDCGSPASPGTLAASGTATLGGGESTDLDLQIYLNPAAEGQTICAEVVVDPAGAIDELVETNNSASTCYEPSKKCMSLTRPNLDANTLTASFPHGCFFGDLVDVELEVCNPTETDAKNYGVVFNIDHGSTVTLWDTKVVAIPQNCQNKDANGVPYPDNGNSQCMDIGGGQPSCINGICHAPCVADADCGSSGLECIEDPDLPLVDGALQKSCQLLLPGGECRLLRTTTNLPVYNTFSQADFTDGYYFIGAIVDWTMVINEGVENEGDNKSYTANKTFCWTRKPDFQPTEVRSLGVIGAGETIPVSRRVHNNGVLGGVYSYRYVLSSNPAPSIYDIALPIVGRGEIADATVEPFGDSIGSDMVTVPAGVVAGDYYLGILVDPIDTVLELDEGNNAFVWCDPQSNGTCLPHVVRVVDSSLRVVTPTLRDATVGQSYNVQLLATGGNGDYVWAVTSGALPPGLVLDTNGLLHGTVLEQGYYTFQVTVTSGAASAAATFVLHGTPARGPLAITTTTLPPAYLRVAFRAELGASGGAPPYAWSCSGLPAWLSLSNYVLGGTPQSVAGAQQVTCTVTDANLSTVAQTYAVQVFDQSTLTVKANTRIEGEVGVPMLEYVSAEGGSGQYSWDFVDETIPAGLAEIDAGNRGALQGTPLACGTFLVGVTVTDRVTGTTDSTEVLVTILCDAPRLTTRNLPVAERGEPYLTTDGAEVRLQAENAVKFEIVMGTLPRGLELAENGLISGTVAVDANPGDYNVAIEIFDTYGGSGLGAITIVVRDPPAPGVEIKETVKKGGCSTTGEGSASGFLPFAALFALLGLRRVSARRIAGIAAVAAAVLLPAAASAQVVKGYANYTRSQVYQRLTDYTPVPGLTDLDNGSPAVNLPFTFTFFGEQYERVYVGVNGILLFSAASTSITNGALPSSTAPNNFIAPWFDDIDVSAASNLRYTIRGTEPNREIVFEWIWITGYSTSDADAGGEMQVSLFQDGTIAMRWGNVKDNGYSASDFSANVGLEDAGATAKSISYLPCNALTASSTYCKSPDWVNNLKDKEAVFTTKPNLQVLATSTLAEGRAGLTQDFTVVAKNDGTKPVTTDIELFASVDEFVSDDDVAVTVIPGVSFGPFAEVTRTVNTVLPRQLVEGRYFLLARLDGADTIVEWNEADNDGGAFRFRVVTPTADLSLDWIGVPSSGAPGSMIAVDLTVSNRGNANAVEVPFSVVLSANEAITGNDLPLYEGTVTVDWQETVDLTAWVEIPADIPAGLYYVGGVIDPASELTEFEKVNNFRAADHGFAVAVDGLRVSTRFPSELQVGAPFCIPLVAEGGDGSYTWTVAEGDLPPGLVLTPGGETGDASLCGEPSAVGIFAFTLEVESGGMTARTQLSMNVVVVPTQLTIASKSLPIASFQHAYEAGLSANGGRPPYTWEVVAGALPEGLAFDTDGLLFGTPLVEGTFTMTVRVTDAANARVEESLRLIVAPPARVTCSSRTLGTLPVGEPITGRLLAGGGAAPYTWETVNTLRLGDPLAADIPEGMGPPGIILGATGELSGLPTEIGVYLWTVDVTDTAGAYTDTCSISLEVVGTQGLTVTTTALPIALIAEDGTPVEYGAKLEAIGGVGTLRWATRPETDLPNGLELSADGFLSGELTVNDLQGEPSRTFSFLVEVRDEQNNRGVASLSVTLRPIDTEGDVKHITETTESGCSTGTGGFSLLALGLVVLGLRRRR